MNKLQGLRGSIVALVTPFHQDGSVNFERLRQWVEWHIENKTDGILANHLKVQVSQAVYQALDALEHGQMEISLGSLVAPDLFGGMGPAFRVGVSGLGYVQADFISAFTDAGINQTRHQVILEVTAEIGILTGLGSVDTTVQNQLVVTDTVIVGHVPEQYTYIDDTEQSLLGKINDYTR